MNHTRGLPPAVQPCEPHPFHKSFYKTWPPDFDPDPHALFIYFCEKNHLEETAAALHVLKRLSVVKFTTIQQSQGYYQPFQ